ncbi:MAG: sulfite exporter TauE/SafE family protein [Gemmataceae bacterium]
MVPISGRGEDAMSADWTVPTVLGVLFLATVIRSAFGFGEALVAVPLLALVLPVVVAAPLAALVSITVAGIVVIQDWRHIHVHSAWRLVLSTLAGIPLGLWMLTSVPQHVVKAILAAIIIGFSAYCLFSRTLFELRNDRLAWLFGFAAGVLGGAYGMNGPPLVIYGALRRWSAEHFRATLQGYFLPASSVVMAGYWAAGLWTPAVTRYYLLSLPLAVAAIFVGRMMNRRLKGRRFVLYVHVGLILVGLSLLIQSLWSRNGLLR